MLLNSCLIIMFSFVFASEHQIKHHDNHTIKDMKKLNWETWCKLQPNGFNCGDRGIISKFYYDIKLQDCRTAEMGGKCLHNINSFKTITECHEACQDDGEHEISAKIGANIFCRLQPDFGGCNGYYPRFYFDVTLRECKGFSYSGCGGNLNRFSSFQLCSAVCMPVVDHRLVVPEE